MLPPYCHFADATHRLEVSPFGEPKATTRATTFYHMKLTRPHYFSAWHVYSRVHSFGDPPIVLLNFLWPHFSVVWLYLATIWLLQLFFGIFLMVAKSASSFTVNFTTISLISCEKITGTINYNTWATVVQLWFQGQGHIYHLTKKLIDVLTDNQVHWTQTDASLCNIL